MLISSSFIPSSSDASSFLTEEVEMDAVVFKAIDFLSFLFESS